MNSTAHSIKIRFVNTSVQKSPQSVREPGKGYLYEIKDLAFKALDFVGSVDSQADIVGFFNRYPQLERPGAEPRYLMFGPTIAHSLNRGNLQAAPVDPCIHLIHTEKSPTVSYKRDSSVRVTCTWRHKTTSHIFTLQLQEPGHKLTAHARVAWVGSADSASIVLVPHPAVQLVLAASDPFNRNADDDGTAKSLIQLFLNHPHTEDTREWKNLITHTAQALHPPDLGTRALTHIRQILDVACSASPTPTRAHDLRNLLC